MRTKIVLLTACIVVAASSCKNSNERYVDLNTGENIELKKDSTTGWMVDIATNKPVHLYVDTKTGDTIYGRTGKVINGYVVKSDKGVYAYTDPEDYKNKSEDAELKIKDGNTTTKVDKDGDVKIENGVTVVKIDGKTGKRKVKKDENITDKVKKVFN